MKEDLYTQADQKLAGSFHALNTIYADYMESGASAEKRPGIGSLFQGWMSSSRPPTLADTKGLAFFHQVALGVKEMEQVCCTYAGELPDLVVSCVKETAQLMLMFQEHNQPRNIKLYLIAAEFHFAPLLPYLPGEELTSLRAQYLARTPRRLMLPNQRKLLAQMEKLLSADSGG